MSVSIVHTSYILLSYFPPFYHLLVLYGRMFHPELHQLSQSCIECFMSFVSFSYRATPLSVLAWRIPGTGEPGGLPSMGSHGVGHD